ncbi:MAG: bifunctional folylpolyglutamate synthase/dihydrofolate synthase [Ignavibacteriales bacterium]|nr:bifunctional folylpolyglutamate synthase/dihydrofolate synthase [Ignavibacteriales bacterium]
MDIQSAINKLFSLHQFGIKLGLDNILNLLEQIGNPHNNIKTIHIAGSNGKGSTASFITSILMEAGYKVGIYTSPHFVKYNERIRINGIMIDDEYVAKFVTGLEDYIEKQNPTFFEITTALAFKYFDDQKVDYAVIETGLGGRLDATNVINPIASVITSISLEHTEHLGNTLEKIAFEKAGIIKNDSSVFTGRMPQVAEKIIREKAVQCCSTFIPIKDYTRHESDRLIVKLKENSFSLYTTPLIGEHQFYNAALAIKTSNECCGIKDGQTFSRGIKYVEANTGIQGRYEIVNEQPKIIFDSAHNPEGINSFINEFSKEFQTYDERILIFGAMRDKSIKEMLLALNPYFTRIYVTKVDVERSATIEELQTIANAAEIKVSPLVNSGSFMEQFQKEVGKPCLVVLGSMYLLGEIKSKKINKNA